MSFAVEPSGRPDEWAWQTTRDGVLVGLHLTQERAQAFVDRGGEPEPVEIAAGPVDDGQFELFGAAA